jgi:pilus assembly protein CpaB
MSSTAAKVIAAVAILLTVVLAILGYKVSRDYAAKSEAAQKQVQKQSETPRILAVVALKPLAAYKKVEKDSVALAEVTVAPKDYYTSLEDVVGKEPLVDVDQGAPVTKRYFAEGNALARSVPQGFQAVSVEVTDIIGVGGFVRPGDIVDVLLYLRDGNDVENTQARVLLKDVRVLAYEAMLVDRPKGLKDDEKAAQQQQGGRRQRTAVLAVPEPLTTKLMLGASLGELRLALHGANTGIAVATTTEGEPLVAASSVPSATMPTVLAAGGLPATPEAVQAETKKQVPEKAITAQQLSRVEPPPSQQKTVRARVIVYRATEVETVTP